jgi:Uma2 family endonuclease
MAISTSESRSRRPSTFLDLDDLPEDVIGEIIDGELHVLPRPDEPHARAAFDLCLTLGNPFYRGIGGPGGWLLLPKLCILFGEQTLVPDLAGWRQERFVEPKKGPILVAPDWICEILSPSTARHDRIRKLPIYARHEVRHAWLIDPVLRTLEVLRLEAGTWSIVGLYEKDEKIRAEPFEAIEIELSQIWGVAPPDEEESEA